MTDTDKLIGELRSKAAHIRNSQHNLQRDNSDAFYDKAADTIAAQQKRIEELEKQVEALKGLDEKPPAHVCTHCGVEFDRTNGPQKYCSDECAKDAKRKRDAEYRAKNREKRNKYNRKYRQQKKADFETYLNGSTSLKHMGGEK